jgi:acyl-CoA thioester hydrolase
MFKTTVTPRFGDADGLRHINNTVLAIWFEQARNPIFKMFVPTLELNYKKWNLIMVKTDFNFLRQMFFGLDIEIRTHVIKIGNTSLTVEHEAWQHGELKVSGQAVMVHFDFIKQKPVRIPDDIREQLSEHLISLEELEKENEKEMKENKQKAPEYDYENMDK